MNTIELLDALQLKAKKDPELRKALFATRSEKNRILSMLSVKNVRKKVIQSIRWI